MKLFHYTCSHSATTIRREKILKPHGIYPGMRLVWLTDLEYPDRDALGLTSHIVKCDRAQYRATVEAPGAVRWFAYRRDIPAQIRDGLELAPGVQPGNWWVTAAPIEITTLEKL